MLSPRHLELCMRDLSSEDLENLEKVQNDRFVFRNKEDLEAFTVLFKKALVDSTDEDCFAYGKISITENGLQILGSTEGEDVL